MNKAQHQTVKAARDQLIVEIAKEQLFIETLEERGLDRLDFHDVSCVGVQCALEMAFAAGQESTVPRHRDFKSLKRAALNAKFANDAKRKRDQMTDVSTP